MGFHMFFKLLSVAAEVTVGGKLVIEPNTNTLFGPNNSWWDPTEATAVRSILPCYWSSITAFDVPCTLFVQTNKVKSSQLIHWKMQLLKSLEQIQWKDNFMVKEEDDDL